MPVIHEIDTISPPTTKAVQVELLFLKTTYQAEVAQPWYTRISNKLRLIITPTEQDVLFRRNYFDLLQSTHTVGI